MKTGRPRPPAVVTCPACVSGQRCDEHRATRDQRAASTRHANGRGPKNGLNGALAWANDVPVPFVPVSTDMEGPPASSSMPPWLPVVPKPPLALPPPSSTQLEESGRSFLDAGPMLARAQGRKELEVVVLAWLALREHARGVGRDAWSGRDTSPGAMRAAEESIERVAKRLREIK